MIQGLPYIRVDSSGILGIVIAWCNKSWFRSHVLHVGAPCHVTSTFNLSTVWTTYPLRAYDTNFYFV